MSYGLNLGSEFQLVQILFIFLGTILLFYVSKYTLKRFQLTKLRVDDFPTVDTAKFNEWFKKEIKSINIFLISTYILLFYGIIMISYEGIFAVPVGSSIYLLPVIYSIKIGNQAKKLQSEIGINWPSKKELTFTVFISLAISLLVGLGIWYLVNLQATKYKDDSEKTRNESWEQMKEEFDNLIQKEYEEQYGEWEKYTNDEYKFKISIPKDWKDYKVEESAPSGDFSSSKAYFKLYIKAPKINEYVQIFGLNVYDNKEWNDVSNNLTKKHKTVYISTDSETNNTFVYTKNKLDYEKYGLSSDLTSVKDVIDSFMISK